MTGPHAELNAWLSGWCTCATGPERHADQVLAAAVFSSSCTPPDAPPGAALVAAKCCLLFFLVDDGDASRLADFVQHVRAGTRTDGDEPTALLDHLTRELLASGRPVEDFRAAVRRWAVSMLDEQVLHLAGLTADEYLAVRRETIFVECLVHCWLALLGLRPPPEALSVLLDRAVRIVITVNDLGSIQADDAEHQAGRLVDINTVLLRSQVLGDRQRAIDEAVTRHNRQVGELRDLRSGVEDRVFTVIKSVVNGNLDGTRRLVDERYPGSAEVLRRLDPL